MNVRELMEKLKEFPGDYDVQVSPRFDDRIAKAEVTPGIMSNYVTLYTIKHDRLRRS